MRRAWALFAKRRFTTARSGNVVDDFFAGYLDGIDKAGTINGVAAGVVGTDAISGIVLDGCDNDAVNFTFGEHGNAVCADLIGGVAVGCNPVGADDHHSNAAFFHHLAYHAVANEDSVEAALLKLPGGESRSLQEWPSFVDEDLKVSALLGGGEQHGQGSSIIRRGQTAGIAVRQYSLPFLNQRGARLANGATHPTIFFFDGQRLLQEQGGELLGR